MFREDVLDCDVRTKDVFQRTTMVVMQTEDLVD